MHLCGVDEAHTVSNMKMLYCVPGGQAEGTKASCAIKMHTNHVCEKPIDDNIVCAEADEIVVLTKIMTPLGDR